MNAALGNSTETSEDTALLAINTIRTLTMDAAGPPRI
jgi:hypothetical protein